MFNKRVDHMVDHSNHCLFSKRGTFYYSRRVPAAVRQQFGKPRFVRCLHTSHRSKAERNFRDRPKPCRQADRFRLEANQGCVVSRIQWWRGLWRWSLPYHVDRQVFPLPAFVAKGSNEHNYYVSRWPTVRPLILPTIEAASIPWWR